LGIFRICRERNGSKSAQGRHWVHVHVEGAEACTETRRECNDTRERRERWGRFDVVASGTRVEEERTFPRKRNVNDFVFSKVDVD
jgi:hypothetical protein